MAVFAPSGYACGYPWSALRARASALHPRGSRNVPRSNLIVGEAPVACKDERGCAILNVESAGSEEVRLKSLPRGGDLFCSGPSGQLVSESFGMLHLFNTISRRDEEFVPLNPPNVGLYTCGPTVYSYIHIGNLRTFLFEDLLRRYLKFKGFKVTQVMNVTDIDDKTIKGANEEGISLGEFTSRFTRAFFEDISAVGIELAEHYPRATEHIGDMVSLIGRILRNGYAYESDGSIYFDVSKFKPYGALTGVKPTLCQVRSRVDRDEYEKQDIRDFALWKAAKPGEPSWDTELGTGRPGWHIECSAMSMRYLGETFDIHTGGVDNMFPHHENEIAQSRAATGKPLARYWLHSEHLLMDRSKMAKSAGNIYTLREITAMGYEPRQVRYFLLSAHYRKQLNFSLDALQQAAGPLARIDGFVRSLRSASCSNSDGPAVAQSISECEREFEAAMDDDLNISEAMGVFFTFIRSVNELMHGGEISENDRSSIESLLERINSVVGVIELGEEVELSQEEDELIKMRREARRSRDWAYADRLREQLRDRGIIIEDTKDGIRIKRLQ